MDVTGTPRERGADAGKRAHGLVVRHAHVARAARQVDSREPAERAAAGPAARRAAPERGDSGHDDDPCASSLEAHRTNPTCAACHRRMDPLGFGLENYDAIGAWRTSDGEHPDRRVGRAARWARSSTAPWRCGDPRARARRVHPGADRQAAHLCARPRPEPADRQTVRTHLARGPAGARLPFLRARARDRAEPAVPDAREAPPRNDRHRHATCRGARSSRASALASRCRCSTR